MKISVVTLFSLFSLMGSVMADLPAPSPLPLWYDEPAKNAMNEALPVGNGRIGALVFGGVERDRVVLDENSFWSGTARAEMGEGAYGDYQVMGNLYVDLHSGPEPQYTCPSGQRPNYDSEDIQFSADGDPSTKWCVDTKGMPVIWQVECVPGGEPATYYTLTSGNDLPQRDPKTWEFSGSQDGQTWTVLDQQTNQPPFKGRNRAETFKFSNSTAYKFYRLTIEANQGDRQVQLSEITVPGIRPSLSNFPVSEYRRELDLSTAISTTRFTRGIEQNVREVFSSHPDNVVIYHWGASHSGSVTGTIDLQGSHREPLTIDGDSISFSGKLSNGELYETIAHVITKGGSLQQIGQTLQVQGADEVLILVAMGTDYIPDASKNFLSGINPHNRLLEQLTNAEKKSYEQLKEDHLKDYQSLFNRLAVSFGKSTPDQLALPIDKRKVLAATTTDPELESLFLQYGRYLLISSSRPGSLPANLQGLWNDSNSPAWHCDYHANINVQMNYWPAESANLSECHLPLLSFIQSELPKWRANSQNDKEFLLPSGPVRGWAVRTGVNPWGGETFVWDKTANAWLCQHLWEHYAFTKDKSYLQNTAYPMIKEVVEFWEDHLKALPDGGLVVPNGWSPEHGPTEDGVTYNQEIVWDLFSNYIDAADALGIDKEYRNKIADMRDHLVGPEIGKWGQLKEWMTDRDDPNDHHRHTSHLFGVYPGRQITFSKTPDLLKAAKVSLDARGPTGDVREWSFAWRTALYARMRDAENAHLMLKNLFSNRNTCLNLFGLHPPLQLDGNFGITAGIIEMLVQSQEGEINLLPALPQDWPEGYANGLRARGGFELSIAWKEGSLSGVTIHSDGGGTVQLRYKDRSVAISLRPGESKKLGGQLDVSP